MSTFQQRDQYRQMLKSPYGRILVAYYLTMAVAGLMIPDDILKTHEWARNFSDFMANIVPQIDRITALNIKPEVNRFYFSVLWAGSPLLFVISALEIFDGRKRGYPMWSMGLCQSSLFMLGLLTMFLWTQFLWAVDPSMKLSKSLFVSGFGRGFYAQVVFFTGAVFAIAGLSVWLLGWLTGYIPRNIQQQQSRG